MPLPINKQPHHKKTRIWLTLVGILAFGTATADTSKEAKLETLRHEIQELRHSLTTDQDRKDVLGNQLRLTEVDIGKLSYSLKQLKRKLKRQAKELKKLISEKRTLQAELTDQQQSLSKQIVASYAMGNQGFLKILLNQQDPVVIGRTLKYYDYFNRARADRISRIDENIAALDKLENRIASETARLEQLHDEKNQKFQVLENSRKSRQQIIVKLEAGMHTKEQRLDRLLQDEQVLVKLLDRLRNALVNIPPDVGELLPFASYKGKLLWPSAGNLNARFGTSRKIGNLKWQGVMINGPEGQEINAIYHGRIVFADWLRGFGLLIILDHDNGYMSLYGHNQSLFKVVGDWVEAGEVIASIGNSGGRAEPGLYFEIRHNGKPANPVLWCRADKLHSDTSNNLLAMR